MHERKLEIIKATNILKKDKDLVYLRHVDTGNKSDHDSVTREGKINTG